MLRHTGYTPECIAQSGMSVQGSSLTWSPSLLLAQQFDKLADHFAQEFNLVQALGILGLPDARSIARLLSHVSRPRSRGRWAPSLRPPVVMGLPLALGHTGKTLGGIGSVDAFPPGDFPCSSSWRSIHRPRKRLNVWCSFFGLAPHFLRNHLQ